MTTDSNRRIIRQAERIFWTGFVVGLAWGVALGVTFGLWVTS